MNDGSKIDKLVDREVRWVPWSVRNTPVSTKVRKRIRYIYNKCADLLIIDIACLIQSEN